MPYGVIGLVSNQIGYTTMCDISLIPDQAWLSRSLIIAVVRTPKEVRKFGYRYILRPWLQNLSTWLSMSCCTPRSTQ